MTNDFLSCYDGVILMSKLVSIDSGELAESGLLRLSRKQVFLSKGTKGSNPLLTAGSVLHVTKGGLTPKNTCNALFLFLKTFLDK